MVWYDRAYNTDEDGTGRQLNDEGILEALGTPQERERTTKTSSLVASELESAQHPGLSEYGRSLPSQAS